MTAWRVYSRKAFWGELWVFDDTLLLKKDTSKRKRWPDILIKGFYRRDFEEINFKEEMNLCHINNKDK